MLKIQRSANGRVVFTLSGRIEAEDVKGLGQLLALETAGQPLVLDLRDVTLVNQDAIKSLSSCEADSVKLENCPARALSLVKLLPVERISATSVVGEFREGLRSTNINQTLMLERSKGRGLTI
jgi:anti-anti-sigma regulatory factor